MAREGFKIFLGVQGEVAPATPTITHAEPVVQPGTHGESSQHTCFQITLRENPLADFVILPPQYHKQLWYSNLLCGVIRGALEMVNMRVQCTFLRDTLCGDPTTDIRVELKEIIKERYEDDSD